jgi:hypothetical protein
MPNEFIIKNGLISQGNITVTGSVTATSITISGSSAATLGSNTFIGTEIISGSLVISGSGTPFTLNTDILEITGSLIVTGSSVVTGSLTVITGSLIEFQVTNTGVKVGNNITDTHTVTGSLSVSGSQTFIGTKTITGSVFITGSKTLIGTNIVTGSMLISGSLTATGTITAQTLVVQTITSSISSITGSTNFGSLVTDTHKFTGSLNVTGALYIATGSVGIGTVSPSQLFEVVGGEIKAGRVDSSNEGGQVSFGRSTDNATAWYIDAYGNTASPQLRFVNVTNAVVAMTITGSNLGIGTSTPVGKLDVTLVNTRRFIVTYDDSIITIKGASDTGAGENLRIIGDNLIFNTNSAGSGTERMRITSGGDINMNATSGNKLVTVKGQTGNGYYGEVRLGNVDHSAGIVGRHVSAGNTDLEFWTEQYSAGGYTKKMTITASGNIGAPTGTNIYNASDIRLKQNVTTITNGLSKINALNPVKFNWIHDFEPTENDKDLLGFIAQEVQTVLPEAVENFGGNSVTVGETVIENPLRVNEKFIIPVLVKAIQELTARVQYLENK